MQARAGRTIRRTVVLPAPLLPKNTYVVADGSKQRRSDCMYRADASSLVLSAVRSTNGLRCSPN